jgi:hypothetical protein
MNFTKCEIVPAPDQKEIKLLDGQDVVSLATPQD